MAHLLLSPEIQTAMKKNIITFSGSLCASVLLLFSCSPDAAVTEETNALDSNTSLNATAGIATADLIGTWNLHSMEADVAVDFNQDGNSSTNILSESSCFDNMYFTFEEDGDVLTTQARLYFGADGNFTCSEKSYSATYEVNQNELTVNFVVNGVAYTEVKTISMTNDGTNDYLIVSLTSVETDAAVYVANDPGNTVASNINKIEFTYIKQ